MTLVPNTANMVLCSKTFLCGSQSVLVLFNIVAFYLLIGFKELSILNTYNTVPTINSVNSSLLSTQKYAKFDREHPSLFISAGLERSGSTVLYNILRILIRNKIDPNLLFGDSLTHKNINTFANQNFAILLKTHWDCSKLFESALSNFNKTKWNIYIFTSYRNLPDQICSEILMGMMRTNKPTKRSIINRCHDHQYKYFSCYNSAYFAYQQNYDDIKNNNISKVIYDIAEVLNITNILTKNDVLNIEYELKNLITINEAKNIVHHPLTFIHSDHIHTEKQKNSTCNMPFIIDAIKSDKKCNSFYKHLNDTASKFRNL